MPQPSRELGTLTVAARRPLPERRMPTGLEAAEQTVVATVRRTLTSVRAWRGPADPGVRAVGG